jgi:hypothetical protein
MLQNTSHEVSLLYEWWWNLDGRMRIEARERVNTSHLRIVVVRYIGHKTKTKLHGLSPQANYTDRATAVYRRS